jgi:hypothetical protein
MKWGRRVFGPATKRVARLLVVASMTASAAQAIGTTLEDSVSLFPGAFSGIAAWRADSILASPGFAGRRSGTRGGEAAELWIAARFRLAGLVPGRPVTGVPGAGRPDGDWLQAFDALGPEPAHASIEILDSPFGKIRLVYGDDFTLMLNPAAGTVTGKAVFVGYGIDAPTKGRNDYEGCEIAGKIAVILRGRPDDGQDWEHEFRRTHTFAAARAHGASAVLFYQGRDAVSGAAVAAESYDPLVPSAYVSERVIRLLLRETGFTLEDVQKKLKEGPFPIATGKRLRFESDARGKTLVTGHNVIGKLPGSDPILKDEVVVIGAHHDHIGFDAEGRLYAGANDNASGTSVVVELARTAGASQWKPKRTVIFATFGGEEMGLLGSRAFMNAPPVDSSMIVAMVNLDMTGMGDGGFGIGGGGTLGQTYYRWRAGLDSTSVLLLDEGRIGGESSDYAPFLRSGIPSIACWSRGEHRHYHDIEDTPHYVRPDILEVVGRGIGSLLEAIADAPAPLRDGFGHERILRDRAFQMSFDGFREADPIDRPRAITASLSSREAMGGDGRITGRFLAIDDPTKLPELISPMRRLGEMKGSSSTKPWLRITTSLVASAEAGDGMRAALMPVMGLATLDRLGADIARSLCDAGLAGAIWSSEDAFGAVEVSDPGGPGVVTEGSRSKDPLPSHALCAALFDARRVIIATSPTVPWRALLEREADAKILLRSNFPAPDPPDSSLQKRVLLIIPIRGDEEPDDLGKAVEFWGKTHVHLDLTGVMETGMPDSTSLRLIHRLRESAWSDPTIELLLGGNLRKF